MTPLVRVTRLVKEYARRGRLLEAAGRFRAVDDVSFDIVQGETYGLVGESGSGKTTTGRCLLRLIEPTSGQVLFRGEDVVQFDRTRLRAARRHMQMVFQDPYSSLNPRLPVGAIIEEPLIVHRMGSRTERAERVAELCALVGLDPAHRHRMPHEFSGGQRQRIGLARALALNPTFIVADEPVSALDMSIQAQVIQLFLDLQRRLGLTYLFIAHDLRLVRDICTRMSVMYRGRIVEAGRTESIFTSPRHPYTQALLSAIPVLDPDSPRRRVQLDPNTVDWQATMRLVAEDHYAAI